ncbi:MAG TPA: tetratricopeptide repeat protein [Longimicrobiales bacterium]
MAESHREEIAKLEALYAGNPGGRVFVHLAEAYRKAGEHERARRILEEGLARHADSASGYVVLGRVLADMQVVPEAETAFRRVLELDGGNLVALRWLGDLARQTGRNTEAAAHYRELLVRNPSNEEVRDLVEIVEREQSGAPPPRPAAAEPGVSTAAAVEEPGAAVAEPVSAEEEPAVTQAPQAGAAGEDAGSWSAAPGKTGEAEESAVEFGLVEIAHPVEAGPPAGDESAAPPSFRMEESDLVARVEEDGTLELDELSRDDEAGPVEIHLLDPAWEAEVAREGDEETLDVALDLTMPGAEEPASEGEALEELDLTDLAPVAEEEPEGEYADDEFLADLVVASADEPQEPALESETLDVLAEGSPLRLLGDETEQTAAPSPGEAGAALSEAALAGLSGVSEPAAESEAVEEPPVLAELPELGEAPEHGKPPVFEVSPELEELPVLEEPPAPEEPPALEELPVLEEHPVIDLAAAAEEPADEPVADELPESATAGLVESEVPEETPPWEIEPVAAEEARAEAPAEAPPPEPAVREAAPGAPAPSAQAPAAAAPPAAAGRAPGETGLVTETMALLYRSQGFHDRAAEVYRALLRHRPDDDRLKARLQEAEAAAGAAAVGADDDTGEVWLRGVGTPWTAEDAVPVDATPYAWTIEEESEHGEPIGAYLQDLVSWRPGDSRRSEMAAPAAEPARPPEPEGMPEWLTRPPPAPWETGTPPEEPPLDPWAAAAADEVASWDPASAARPPHPSAESLPLEEVPADPWLQAPLREAPAADAVEAPWTPLELDRDAGTSADIPAGTPPRPLAEQQEGEESDDEDLEMFRSWLQSLKK